MTHATLDVTLTSWVLAGILVFVNLLVCFALARAESLTRQQALLQGVIVWLVPVLGAAIIGTFLWSEAHPRRRLDATISPVEGPGLTESHQFDGGGHAS
jgi:hypothetical protein